METVIFDRGKKNSLARQAQPSQRIKLSEITNPQYINRLSTKISELDRVVGGGIVPGMVTLIAGEPGIGKSTLLLQLANNILGKVIYVAGEESASQIANRASRLGVKNAEIDVLEDSDVDQIIASLSTGEEASLVIVDSIQTLTTHDLTGTAGSIGQVRECANRLTAYAKRVGIPLFIVGHVTKEGSIAGPRVLEHIVDTVLWFEGDRKDNLRIIRAVKNRFGPTDEVGIFSMEEKGLFEVTNPSKLFLGATDGKIPGSAVTSAMEGTRPLLVEIQALVAPTKLSFPKRSSSGIDPRRLEIIVAVLTRRVGLPLWDYDVFVNVAGGIKLIEPAADLALALAIASSFYNKPVSSTAVAIGEVGLLGEVREVSNRDKRAKEAKRLGFATTITHKEASTLSEAVKKFVLQK